MQQLCEAGEEEFLEIMALVGMASKPLHVRRLQKALQEWATSPGSCTLVYSSFCLISTNEKRFFNFPGLLTYLHVITKMIPILLGLS